MFVLIINSNPQYKKMFLQRGWEVSTVINEENLLKADLVQFTGGEDVSPSFYFEDNTHSFNNFHRDLFETGIFKWCVNHCKPMAGICRGAQFLNVMCGGKMKQNVSGHAVVKGHKLTVFDVPKISGVYHVTSTHHQMMVPAPGTGVIGLSEEICGEDGTEIIIHPFNKCLGFQPHPEFHTGECQDLYFNLLPLILEN